MKGNERYIRGKKGSKQCPTRMSLTNSGYRQLGLELVELEKEHPQWPRIPSTTKEKNDGARDLTKLLLKEALA